MNPVAVVFAGGAVAVAGTILSGALLAKSAIGYRATGSPTLLRLSASFLFLVFSMAIRAANYGVPHLQPYLQFAFIIMETFAFFFLALAHLINIRVIPYAGSFLLPVIGSITPESLAAAFRAITIYFASFSIVGSLLSIQRKEVFFTSLGFASLVAGSFIEWAPTEAINIFGIPLRLAGIVLLSFPLLPWSKGRVQR